MPSRKVLRSPSGEDTGVLRWAVHDLRRRVAAPFARCWLADLQAHTQAPRPSDAPEAFAAGPGGDHVLIFGSGPAVGWGVLTHDIALPGALARALRCRTGRGTKVELVADMRITVSNALPKLLAVDVSRFDVIVVVLGGNDATILMPLPKWRERFLAVLSGVHQNSSGSRTFVTGIPPIESVPGFETRLGRMIASHALQMNSVTARLCGSAVNATYIPLPAVEPENELGVRDGQTYRKWADAIADIIAPQIDDLKSRNRAGT